MAILFTGVVVIILYHIGPLEGVVRTCAHHHCNSYIQHLGRRFLLNSTRTVEPYCELYVNSAGIQGSCKNPATWNHGSVPKCSGTSLSLGDHCYCSLQGCVDQTLAAYNSHHEKASNSSGTRLMCNGHYCTGKEVCLLSTDARKGTKCGPIHRHITCTRSHDTHDVCACDNQSCIDAFHLLNTKDSHVQCGDTTCHIHLNSVCVLSVLFSRFRLRCVEATTAAEKAALPQLCTSSPSRGHSCSCQNQICVKTYGKVEPMDDHVNCGNKSCHVHSGQYCILTKTRQTYTYQQYTSSVQQHCAASASESRGHSLCTSNLHYGQICHCKTQSCVDNYSKATCDDLDRDMAFDCDILQSSDDICNSNIVDSNYSRCYQYCQLCHNSVNSHTAQPTTSSTTSTTTTISTTTIPTTTTTTIPTTPIVYPKCNEQNCGKLYLQYCHLFLFENKIEGRCMPFQVGNKCSGFQDVNGNGCTCSTTTCSEQIVTSYYQHLPTTTTQGTFAPIHVTTALSTTPEGIYDCFGEACQPSKSYCHIYQHYGRLNARCMPFNIWPLCNNSRTDVSNVGCSCTSASCTDTVVKANLFKGTTQNLPKESTTSVVTMTRLPTPTAERTNTMPPTIANHSTETTTSEYTLSTTVSQKPTEIISTKTVSTVGSTASYGLHCFDSKCSSSQVCRVSKDGNIYTGYCAPKMDNDLLTCERTTLSESAECDCVSQDCIDIFKATVMPAVVTNSLTTFPSTNVNSPTSFPTTNANSLTTFPSTNAKSPTTIPSTRMTPELTNSGICHDLPGVDCLILNSTNICASPFSHQYCAAFCGHCKSDSVQTVFG